MASATKLNGWGGVGHVTHTSRLRAPHTPTTYDAQQNTPHHVQGIFKGAIVHGLLVGSLFGTIFGVTFPGCVYLQQSFKVRG